MDMMFLGLDGDVTIKVQEFYRLCNPGECPSEICLLVKEKIEFDVNQMNWPLKDVALFPQLLGYSMEKRIVPRCNVIKALIAKGLLGSEPLRHIPVKQLVTELLAILRKVLGLSVSSERNICYVLS
ncbi:unnamed protein product [Brassica rapa]|uniref:Uncharacterized protein n=2 Tax=Brassica campestris TaxID=3711 RepID=A0A8D9H928_BRACM|nr:unnamed protein product [Brassica rapa]